MVILGFSLKADSATYSLVVLCYDFYVNFFSETLAADSASFKVKRFQSALSKNVLENRVRDRLKLLFDDM